MIVAFCMCFDRSWNVFTFWVRRRFFGANSCDKRHTLDFRLPWVFWLQSLKLNFLDVVLFNVFFWQQQVFEFFAFKVPSFSLFSCLETDAKQERKECVVEKMEIIICLVWNEIDFLINCPMIRSCKVSCFSFFDPDLIFLTDQYLGHCWNFVELLLHGCWMMDKPNNLSWL